MMECDYNVTVMLWYSEWHSVIPPFQEIKHYIFAFLLNKHIRDQVRTWCWLLFSVADFRHEQTNSVKQPWRVELKPNSNETVILHLILTAAGRPFACRSWPIWSWPQPPPYTAWREWTAWSHAWLIFEGQLLILVLLAVCDHLRGLCGGRLSVQLHLVTAGSRLSVPVDLRPVIWLHRENHNKSQ